MWRAQQYQFEWPRSSSRVLPIKAVAERVWLRSLSNPSSRLRKHVMSGAALRHRSSSSVCLFARKSSIPLCYLFHLNTRLRLARAARCLPVSYIYVFRHSTCKSSSYIMRPYLPAGRKNKRTSLTDWIPSLLSDRAKGAPRNCLAVLI